MPVSLLLGLIIGASQASPNPANPTIISMKLGLAGATFTGTAAGWPFFPERWNWLTATVHNPLDHDLDAALTFRTIAPQATGRFHISRGFRLPANCVMRVSFPVRSSPPEPPSKLPTKGALELKIGGEVVDRKEPLISFVEENVYALGFLGQSNGLDYALVSNILYPNRGPELQSSGLVRGVTINDDLIPEHPLGLDFLDTLIIVQPSSHDLRPGQWQAIDGWVQSGGHVIFAAGADQTFHEIPDVAPILPAYPVGTRRVTVLPSLAQWSGEELATVAGCTISELRPQSGNVLLRDGDTPLVVHTRRGAGTVTCVALDVERGLTDLNAYRRFWLELLRRLHQPRLVDVDRIDPYVHAIAEQFAGRRAVGAWLPILLIISYLATIGITIRGARRRAAGELRWIGVCGVALLFTVASVTAVWGTSPAPSRNIYEFWVATGVSPTKTFRIDNYLNVLPALRGDDELRLSDRDVQLVPTQESGAAVVDSTVRATGPAVRFLADKGRLRTLHMNGQTMIPGIRVRGVAGDRGVTVHLENQSEFDLERSFFKLGRRVIPVGSLRKGGEVTVDVRPATGSPEDDRFEPSMILDASGRLRRSILTALFVDPLAKPDSELLVRQYRGWAQGTSSQSVFAGWVDSPALNVSWNEIGLPTTSNTLGLLAIEPEWELAGETFWLPRGSMVFRLTEAGARQYYFGKSVFRSDQPAPSSLRFEFAIPDWAAPAAIEQATLSINFSSDAYQLRVFAADGELPSIDGSAGRRLLTLPKSASNESGKIAISLIVEPKAAYVDAELRQGHRWSIDELDVECLCRRIPTAND